MRKTNYEIPVPKYVQAQDNLAQTKNRLIFEKMNQTTNFSFSKLGQKYKNVVKLNLNPDSI